MSNILTNDICDDDSIKDIASLILKKANNGIVLIVDKVENLDYVDKIGYELLRQIFHESGCYYEYKNICGQMATHGELFTEDRFFLFGDIEFFGEVDILTQKPNLIVINHYKEINPKHIKKLLKRVNNV